MTAVYCGKSELSMLLVIDPRPENFRTSVLCDYFLFTVGLGLLFRRFMAVPVQSREMLKSQESPGQLRRAGRYGIAIK